jgi:hypothetical protein
MKAAPCPMSMTRLTVYQKAPAGHTFAPGCFDAWIGETIPIVVDDPLLHGAEFTLLGYEVTDAGTAVGLKVEAESPIELEIGVRPYALSEGLGAPQ